MDDKTRTRHLFERYMTGEATEDEYDQLLQALDDARDGTDWAILLRQYVEQQQEDPHYDPGRWEHLLSRIVDNNPSEPVRRSRPVGRQRSLSFSRAAAVLLILVVGISAWYGISRFGKKSETASSGVRPTTNDVLPGGNRAKLTLSNGSVILLNNAANGVLATQGNGRVLKLKSGLLRYEKEKQGSGEAGTTVYNTITTPRGGQYQLVLADGTKVWLNAASSLSFPVAFTEGDRVVRLTGEAYFEVTHDRNHPFRVQAGNVRIEDLGTHFDVMAYADESALKSTLLEGSIRVSRGGAETVLTPGQQVAVSNQQDGIQLIRDADVDEAVAWKNGLFEFSDADVGTIMRQLARWYDVEIVYLAGVPSGHLTGKIPRHTNLSNVMKMMQLSGIHFNIEGRKIIVFPQ